MFKRWPVGVAAGLVLVPLIGTTASATSGTLWIASDMTLAEDHYGSIVIAADDVTLDCNGFRVIGPGALPDGILIDGLDGVTVKDCVIVGFEESGIKVPAATGPALTGNVAMQNFMGYYVGFVSDSSMRGNLALDNTGTGITFEGEPSWGHLVEDNVATGSYNGFYITAVSQSVFRGNVASSNEASGFALDQDVGPDNTFEGNEAADNGERGFIVDQSSDNHFIANATHDNGWAGISLGRSHRNTVRGNVAYGNGDGIFLGAADDNVVVLNDLSLNVHGILLSTGSDRNVLRRNEVGWTSRPAS